MEQKRNACRVAIRKSERKRQLGRHGRRGESSVEISCVFVAWMCVAEFVHQRWDW